MNEMSSHPQIPTVLADLGPLPEVVESDSDATWKMFLMLQTGQGEGFLQTQPSAMSPLIEARLEADAALTVQDVMIEARRKNRVCPSEPHWQRFYALLKEATGREPPPPMTSAEFSATPPLVKRIRVRDQVEWAAQHGQLPRALSFFRCLSEDLWIHMGR